MKKYFWIGFLGLLLFEIANVYFIMPMPGSQEMNSIDAAYFLYKWRWIFRGLFALLLVVGLFRARWHRKRKWLLALPLLLLGLVIYMANFVMAADHMFYQPKHLLMATATANKVDTGRLVIGIRHNGESKAYPIQFLGYHHQVVDTIGGKPVIVTYCTVCRTGRVYEPLVDGKPEQFRLVGMDHFNAMFEDATTKSWWRQVNGEAITGKLKGKRLPEMFSTQTSLAQWLAFNPGSLIMQADPAFASKYTSNTNYEEGRSRDRLTGTDSLSWNNKSWVAGVKAGGQQKAFDWNTLKQVRLIEDELGGIPLFVVLGKDQKSLFAFEKPLPGKVELNRDTIILGNQRFRIDGQGIDSNWSLKPLPVYQEFWHSWKEFNPSTKKSE